MTPAREGPVTNRVEFGEFVLDLDTRELRRGRTPVSLSPKAFQLLGLLVERSPKALSKTELQEGLWPGTYVVEKNVTNLIAEIREALGEAAAQPRFVRTVHRFGYAFQAPPAFPPAGAARFRLVWAGTRAALRDGTHVIGRDPDLELFLDSASVSRQHARITIAGDDAVLDDLGSKNGTYVGDRRVEAPLRLTDGDVIRIGSIDLTFQAVHAVGSTETRSL